MAAYASTVTLATNKALRIQGTGWGMLIGTIDITNYNATTTEETSITKHFKSYTVGGSTYKCYLIPEAVTDNAYNVEFIPTTGKFKAYQESGSSSGVRTECATDTDVGACQFIAVGLIAH